MKNLIILNKGHIVPESRTYPDLDTETAVFDPVSDSVTFFLSNDSSLIEVQQFMKSGEIKLLASFPKNDPFDTLLCATHFADSCQLVFVFSQGDIVTATYDPVQPDPDTTVAEIVGSIDDGIKTACWSPDEETLSILTNENKLLLLSRLFEPVAEKALDPKDLSTSQHVSVGWGKKETQFQGRGARALEREKDALKHAGLDIEKEGGELRDPTLGKIEKGTLSPFDDHLTYISWRGDCEYLSISTTESVDGNYERRVIRVFTREGELDSISEAVDGLENNLSWKPQGSLIASTQRHIDEEIGEEVLDLVFFERNGLRHGEFNTRVSSTERILNIEWSSNSEVLALQLTSSVQLWTSKNYHWYLKQEIFAPYDDEIKFIKFHPEKPLTIMVGSANSGVQIIDLAYKVTSGPAVFPDDVGMIVVVDGTTAMITPLAIANVPPPVSFREFDVSEPIIDIAVSKSNETYATLTKNEITISSLDIIAMKKGRHPQMVCTIKKESFSTEIETSRQISFIKNDIVAVILDSENFSKIILIDLISSLEPTIKQSIDISPKIVLSKPQADFNALTYQTIDGKVNQLTEDGIITEICQFPQLCREYEVAIVPGATEWDDQIKLVGFGISANGKLFANDQQIAIAATSLKVSESQLLFTTAQSQLKFVHLNSESYKVAAETDLESDERIRSIERGSLLVSVIPSKASVVLQAPRGNLETICPRIMVLAGVRKLIKEKHYKEAFLTCRTHRIDLDILHDYDPELFFSNLEHFVKEINKIEYLDLFVSCLHEEDVAQTKYRETAVMEDGVNNTVAQFQNLAMSQQNKFQKKETKESKINKICEGILSVLLRPEYSKKYMQTIITAYACEKPANLHAALELITSFTDTEELEKAVIHLCFLQDINKLYNTSLGLYDIKLTLQIAQQSQMDPKEYLPFLQHLHVQDPIRKRFLIDTHLKNFSKALHSLAEIGEPAYTEFDEFVIEHDLYKVALNIYRYDNKRSDDILKLYADSLYNSQEYAEAGITYETLGYPESALESYILAKRWIEALTIVQHTDHKGKLADTANKLVASLTDDHKYSAAAEIEFHFLKNIEEALKLYSKDYFYEEAILLATKEDRLELIENIIDPSLGEGFGTIAELLADCKGQINSQLRRIRELREKKQEDPYAFYGNPDDMDTPDNVSVAASETSTTPSFFTRYTGKTGGTAKTGASRRSSKNRKREERKRAKGRKGTIYEEEYLVKSVGRLIERLDQTEPEAVRLIEGLIRRRMREQAYQIQRNFVEVIEILKENIEEIHAISERDRERIDDNGEVYYVPEIPAPAIRDFPKKNTLDF